MTAGTAPTIWSRLGRFAARPGDTDEVRLEKLASLVVAGSCCLAGVVWTAMYVAVFGVGWIASLPAAFVAIVGSALGISHLTGNHRWAVCAQIICITEVTSLISWSIGGVADSGFVIIWAVIGPITALIFFRPPQAALWMLLYLGNVAITVVGEPTFSARAVPIDPMVRHAFLAMNLTICMVVVFVFNVFFVSEGRKQRERADRLLLNILPDAIAPRLKRGEVIADYHDEASVLFADMVGSTPMFAGASAHEVVDWLNEAFSAFDRLTVKYGVEKIRTIGDNYMVAAGVPEPRADHAEVLVRFALDAIEVLDRLPARNGRKLQFRFGIHTGPMVAGVIGEVKFQYDLWGDAVNVAARMESHGEVGRVHISDATHERVSHAFACTSRGEIALKGRGAMTTWFVDGPRADAPSV